MIFSPKTIWQLWARFDSNISTAQKSTLFPILYWIIEPYIDQAPLGSFKMATELTAQTTKIILTKAEDWERWYQQLRGHVDREIWTLLDLEADEKDEQDPIEQPQKPRFSDFNQNATIFVNLSQAQ